MKNREFNYLFKIVIVGNSNVGKSSILLRFADNEFNETYITTIGVDFRFKCLELDGKKVKLQIWDTAGQERFRTITSSYYKGAQFLIIAYDILSMSSFNDATGYWFNQIKNYCPPQTLIMLVGNKADLAERRQVPQEQAMAFAKENGIEYIETSAKEAENVEAVFVKASQLLIQREEQREAEKTSKIREKRKARKEQEQQQTASQQAPAQKISINGPAQKKKALCC